jgi:DNA-binding transcriptional LysR family regulator
MLAHAARIAGEAQLAQDVAAEMRTGVSGRLRLSLPAEFGQAWLGRAAAAFMVAYPDVVLDIQTNDGSVDFARDGCDVAVVLRTLPDSRMVRKRLGSLERGLFAAPSYLQRQGMPRALDDLDAHRCLITQLQRDENTWDLFHKRRKRTVQPEWHATVPSIGLLRELVLGGAGIGMLNDALVQADLRNSRLVRLLPEWRGPPVTATAVIPGHRLITKRSRLFLDFIADFVRHPR